MSCFASGFTSMDLGYVLGRLLLIKRMLKGNYSSEKSCFYNSFMDMIGPSGRADCTVETNRTIYDSSRQPYSRADYTVGTRCTTVVP